MTKLESSGIPSIGNTARFPKLRHDFSVSIETSNEELVEAYTILEQQVVSFDIGTENLGMPMLTHVKSSVILWLQDDVSGALMTALRKIQQTQDSFNVTLNVLYSDKVIEQFTFGECRCSALQHSIFSYESSSDSISLWRSDVVGDNPSPYKEYRGTLKASSARDYVMKLLQVEFMHYGHRVLAASESDMLDPV